MLGKSTLRTGNDGIQFDFHIYSSPLNALSKMDGINPPPPFLPPRGEVSRRDGGGPSRSVLTFDEVHSSMHPPKLIRQRK